MQSAAITEPTLSLLEGHVDAGSEAELAKRLVCVDAFYKTSLMWMWHVCMHDRF